MAKYAEVREKQRHVDAVQERGQGGALARGVWVGFTFKAKKEADKAMKEQEARANAKAEREREDEEDDSLYTLF